MADVLDGMDDMFADSDAVQPQTTPQVTPEPVQPLEPAPAPTPEKADQPRAADGTFAPKEPVQPTQTPAPVQQKPLVDPEQFKGYLEEREKRQALERRLKELESRAPIEQPQIPSVQTDPAAWEAYQQQLVQQTRTSTIFDVSETMAREKHGDEPVSQAMEWAMERAQQSPAFAAEYLRQKHPIDWAVKQQKRDVVMSKIGDDPDAWVRARYAELSAATPNQAAQPFQAASPQSAAAPAQAVPQPPRSIATATAAGGGANVVPLAGEFAMTDELFNR